MIAATQWRKLSALFVAALATAAMAAPTPAGATIGIDNFDFVNLDSNGDPATQAGSHPNTDTTSFGFDIVFGPPTAFPPNAPYANESLKDAAVRLPAGLVANPRATPQCSQAQFAQPDGVIFESCPPETQIGYVHLEVNFVLGQQAIYLPLYNMEVPPGTPARFAFSVVGVPSYLAFRARTGDDYGITALNANAPATLSILSVEYVLWGVPADPAHDDERKYDSTSNSCARPGADLASCDHPSSAPLKSFLTLPTSCVGPVETDLAVDSWDSLGDFATASSLSHDNSEPSTPVGFTGCNALDFSPSVEARPTTNVADAASGLDVDINLPVHEACDPGPPVSCETGEAHLKDTVVTLPEGIALNPSAANGLSSCSEAQFGFTSKEGDTIHTTPDPGNCPEAAKLGSVEIDTQLLDHPLKGAVYAAEPRQNPFGSLLAIYITVDDPLTGTVIKLAGEVQPDPQTGRLTTTFKTAPQLPFEDFKLHFFGGAGGVLRTPAVCGTYQTTTSLTPWSAPESGPPATPSDTWAISQAPGGSSCPTSQGARPNAPDLDAGSIRPVAGASTPTVIDLRRADGSQEFSRVSLTVPPGLTGKLAGIGQCSDAALATAASKSGKEEKASPSCPAASRIGTVEVAAGAGPAPYNTQGTAYLTGPYKGAPLGMAIVTPATAGPFDLGTVVVRVALNVDSTNARITAISDPIPSILQGVPLDIRSARILLDRPDFTRNGTSCDPSSFEGTLVSTLSQSASLSERFQLGECSSLAFKPKLSIRLKGGTKRGAHPALTGSLRMPVGGANIARASVALPHSEFLDQGHIGTVCTRVQFAADQCPAASVYGQARATSPLVDYTLEGPVYLRSSSNKLPDLVAALHGPLSQPIEVEVVGRIDSIKGGIRTTFEGVPDLPVSSFTLEMRGGAKGLLQNSTNICKGVNRATALFEGQNGKAADLFPALKPKCPKARRGASQHRSGR